MKFYHGTKEKVWKEIQSDGILWGMPNSYNFTVDGKELPNVIDKNDPNAYRYTYLCPDMEYANDFGKVLLEVDYEPRGVSNRLDGKAVDNFAYDKKHSKSKGFCWQFSVFIPIPISKVKRVAFDPNFDWGQMYCNLNKENKRINHQRR